MNDKTSHKTQIVIALIGAVTTIVAALIAVLPNLMHKEETTLNKSIVSAMVNESETTLNEPAASSVVKEPETFNLKAVINDKDGYTNIRHLASINGQIIDQVYAGEVFYTHQQNSNWWQVKSPRSKVGYMHNSRIQLLK